jgi:hypothetical protein
VNTDEVVVEEGDLVVSPFSATAAELLPTRSEGSVRGRHNVALDNRGNQPVQAEVVATDPSAQLRFRVRPRLVTAEPGAAAIARLRVRGRRPLWRGAPKERPFQVTVQPRGEAPLVVAGTYAQRALTPGWLGPAAGAALAAVVAAALLWFLVLRPAVQSAARDTAHAATAALQQRVDQQGKAIKDLQSQPSAPTTPTPATATPAPSPAKDPVDGRLQMGQLRMSVPDKTTVSLTDLIFENPNGDGGQIQLRRVGTGGDVSVLLDPRLDNFRDLDYHFVEPIVLTAGQSLQLDLHTCKPSSAAPAGSQCSSNVYYTGYRTTGQ